MIGFVTAMHQQVAGLRAQLAEMQDKAEHARCEAYASATASTAVVYGTAEVYAQRNRADADDLIASATEFGNDA